MGQDVLVVAEHLRGEIAGFDHPAANVIQPDTLAEVIEFLNLIDHGQPPIRSLWGFVER